MFEWLIRLLGKMVVAFILELGEVVVLTFETVREVFFRRFKAPQVLEQMKRMGNDSLPVAMTTILFVGMVFAIQIAYEFVKFGANRVVGGIVGIAVARELAPLLTGVVLAGRMGAAIAAELGTMNVTQQVDALRALGSDPVRYLVVPRFLAGAIMLPVLTMLADVVGFVGGYLVTVGLVGVSSFDFLSSAETFLKISDIWGGLLKSIIFGMIIAVVASYKGLHTRGGAKGVGESTTASVVVSLISIFVVNYFMSVAIFK